MGGKASVTQRETTEAVTNALMNTASKCEAQTKAVIQLKIDKIGGNLTIGGDIDQQASAEALSCKQGQELNSLLQNGLQQSLTQAAKADGFSLWGNSSSTSDTLNKTLSTMNMKDFQECLPQSDAEYSTQVGVVSGNVVWTPKITQKTMDTIRMCVQNNKQVQNNIQKINSTINQQAETGLSLGLAGTIVMVVLIVAAVIAMVVISKALLAQQGSGKMPPIIPL